MQCINMHRCRTSSLHYTHMNAEDKNPNEDDNDERKNKFCNGRSQ